MGGGNTKNTKKNNDQLNQKESSHKKLKKKGSLTNSKSPILTTYKLFQYKYNNSYLNTNLLIYTSHENMNNDFKVMDEKNDEITKSNIFKASGVAVGYWKGNKIDPNNQDKFFVLLDGNIEVFCVVDGHGPYGNILSQSIQDKLFKVIIL